MFGLQVALTCCILVLYFFITGSEEKEYLMEIRPMQGPNKTCPTLDLHELAYFVDTHEVVQGIGNGEYVVLYYSEDRPIFVIKEV